MTYLYNCVKAIIELNQKYKGEDKEFMWSRAAIKKSFSQKHSQKYNKTLNTYLRKALKQGVEEGVFIQEKLSFQLTDLARTIYEHDTPKNLKEFKILAKKVEIKEAEMKLELLRAELKEL